MAALPLFSALMPKITASFAPSFAPSRSAAGGPARRSVPDSRTGSLFDDPPASPSAFLAPLSEAPSPRPAVPATPVAAPILDVPPASPARPASPIARTEAALREAGLAGRFWRGDALSTSPLPSTPSGFRLLDAELPGGGWPSRCLTELLLAHPGVGEIRFLASTLSALTQAGREIVLLAPPHIPDPTGWAQLGIDMRRVLVVRTTRPADRLWALDESLRSSAFGALVAWLPEDKTLARHDALRRLQSAAASADGLTFLMRPSAAQDHASPAPLRLTLANGPLDGTRRTLSVRMLKRRGPVLARPLTLLLPEVHPGLRPFGLGSGTGSGAGSSVASSAACSVNSRPAAPTSRRTSPSSTAPSALRLPPSIEPHALAGSPLSDAAA